MVVPERNSNETSSNYGSNSGPTTTTSRRNTRTLNTSSLQQQQQASSTGSSANMDSDDSLFGDSDSENSVRVGSEYQAVIPDSCLPKKTIEEEDYPDKAVMIWTPHNDLDEDDLRDYISLAGEKYKYNLEQALGILFWHDFNLQCALSDLPNYAPYPDEWTPEDRALFEQAYQFHNKNFHKINQLLPDKKLSSIIKYYYTWKKVKSQKSSYLEKQIRKNSSQLMKDEGTDSMVDFPMEDDDSEVAGNSKDQQYQHHERGECSHCLSKNLPPYYNTKFGLLCKPCYLKQKSSYPESNKQQMNGQEDMETLDSSKGHPFLEKMALKEIVREHFIDSTTKVLQGYDNEINELNTKIQLLKQENEKKKSSLAEELPDLSLINQNNNRVISRWTNDEMLLIMWAIKDYGKDFKFIADIIGTKTESQIKNYFLQNETKLKALMAESGETEDLIETNDNDFIVEESSYYDQQQQPQSNNKANKIPK